MQSKHHVAASRGETQAGSRALCFIHETFRRRFRPIPAFGQRPAPARGGNSLFFSMLRWLATLGIEPARAVDASPSSPGRAERRIHSKENSNAHSQEIDCNGRVGREIGRAHV